MVCSLSHTHSPAPASAPIVLTKLHAVPAPDCEARLKPLRAVAVLWQPLRGMTRLPCRRKSYRPDLITYESVKEEAVTGKQYICSWPDKEGRPVIVMIPRKENTKPSDQQMRHLVYHLEAASRKADETGAGSTHSPQAVHSTFWSLFWQELDSHMLAMLHGLKGLPYRE